MKELAAEDGVRITRTGTWGRGAIERRTNPTDEKYPTVLPSFEAVPVQPLPVSHNHLDQG